MMIFYEKDTGRIVGTVNGRIHSPEEMNMWVGDKDKTERIICQWVEKEMGTGKNKKKINVPERDPELFETLENTRRIGKEYKVDPQTKKIKKKTKDDIKKELDELEAARAANPTEKRKNTVAELLERVRLLEGKISDMEKGIK